MSHSIPFNFPYLTGKELSYITDAKLRNRLAGDGFYTKRCHQWLEENIGCGKALLTHSCTAALEMSALLLNIQPGDEVIMPSYTFVSTANAFVLRGAVPVFVDIREDTLNINEKLIKDAITEKTRAIVPVHYAGVGCEMDAIQAIAADYELAVIEDAAQGILARYKGNLLGTIGDFGTLSFHETKNIISGEGGALLINKSEFIARAEIIREKGTDRSQFFRGEVDKYTWQDVGSSFLPGELIAAFLYAQLENAELITQQRLAAWNYYHQLLEEYEQQGLLRRPMIPAHCEHNAHIYYVLLNEQIDRQHVLDQLKQEQIFPVFHYVPLHSSPAGKRFGRTHGSLQVTDKQSKCLLRLPLWLGLSGAQQERIVQILNEAMSCTT